MPTLCLGCYQNREVIYTLFEELKEALKLKTEIRDLRSETKALRRLLSDVQHERELLKHRLAVAEKDRDAYKLQVFKWEERYDALAKHAIAKAES